MQFAKALMTLASMAGTIAAPTAVNSSVTVVGDWRPKFVRTQDTQEYCKFNGASRTLLPAALLESCKELADYFRSHHGYYQASGWSMAAPNELVGLKNCHIRMANGDNANTVNVGNGDLAAFMDEVFGLRDNARVAQGAQWLKHRRITASSFNDQTNLVAWTESITVAQDVLRYWISKSSVRTTADDLRTLSLLVMSRAGFGKSFKFEGHDEEDVTISDDLEINYKDCLKMILENCVLIFALGRNFLAKPWLPRKLRQVHAACVSFQKHLTQVYEDEKRSLAEGGSKNRNFMNSLVRASQDEATASKLGGLTESEIYGNMFTFNFAGHDTTAHTFTFALYFLASNPAVQDWISEEIHHVMGDRAPDEWLYSDYPRLKRCLAVIYETLRLYTPVPTSKVVDTQTPQTFTVGEKTLVLPPKTMIVPSYASLQTDPKYWGRDSLEWRPSRFIASTSAASLADAIDTEEFVTPARGTFLAWSGGPRDCVGRKFSQVESVATIATLFRGWRVDPVREPGETADAARQRVLCQIESDSAPVLLLQILHPERCPLVWSRR
ncbi:hypothetical protein KJ359_011799 [Pestalotiopsis sp. 9143b]|nr:hypothetical protein KJ359_011799 [Pestalotiopsis sp. 9143b]